MRIQKTTQEDRVKTGLQTWGEEPKGLCIQADISPKQKGTGLDAVEFFQAWAGMTSIAAIQLQQSTQDDTTTTINFHKVQMWKGTSTHHTAAEIIRETWRDVAQKWGIMSHVIADTETKTVRGTYDITRKDERERQ